MTKAPEHDAPVLGAIEAGKHVDCEWPYLEAEVGARDAPWAATRSTTCSPGHV